MGHFTLVYLSSASDFFSLALPDDSADYFILLYDGSIRNRVHVVHAAMGVG